MNVLVVGAGIAGLATACGLAEIGVEVELVERRPMIEALGSGITLIGPALRALERLGMSDACVEAGYPITSFETIGINGILTSKFDLPSPVGSGLPGMLGMMRPTLHKILSARAAALGTTIHTGLVPTLLEQDENGVEVDFSDGQRRRYDVVVGADGVRSTMRENLVGPVPLVFRGQGCIRAVVPRQPQVTGEVQYEPVGNVFIGFTPISEDLMYMYCSFPVQEQGWPTTEELVALAEGLTAPFGGFMPRVRADMVASPRVNLAKFSTVLAPEPWALGRAVLVGDAAHCPTPQLAAGAAMCLEDAVVLSEELAADTDVESALQRFSSRRYERCRLVVETATQLAHWQTFPGDPDAQHKRLIADAFERLAQPC